MKTIVAFCLLIINVFGYEIIAEQTTTTPDSIVTKLIFKTNNYIDDVSKIEEYLKGKNPETQLSKSELYQYNNQQFIFNKSENYKYKSPDIKIKKYNDEYVATAVYEIGNINETANNDRISNGMFDYNLLTHSTVDENILQKAEDELGRTAKVEAKFYNNGRFKGDIVLDPNITNRILQKYPEAKFYRICEFVNNNTKNVISQFATYDDQVEGYYNNDEHIVGITYNCKVEIQNTNLIRE